jgi:hypothetical protein
MPTDTVDHVTAVLRLVEPVLAVFALHAQISAGLWRRNGLSMREQNVHYTGVTLRDRTFALDLFLLQAVACVLQPDHLLRLLVAQFDMVSWFAAPPQSTFEPAQALFLAEECLQLVTGTWWGPCRLCRHASCSVPDPILDDMRTQRWCRSGGSAVLGSRACVSGASWCTHCWAATPPTRSWPRWSSMSSPSRPSLTRCSKRLQTFGTALEGRGGGCATTAVAGAVLADLRGVGGRARFPDGGAHGFYELKEASYAEYEPYFFYARRQERERADEGARAHQQRTAGTAWAPPRWQRPSCAFARLRHIMATPTFLALVGYPLLNYCDAVRDASASGTSRARAASLTRRVGADAVGNGGSKEAAFIPANAPVSQTLVEMALHLAMLAVTDAADAAWVAPDADEAVCTLSARVGRNADGSGLPTWSSFVLLATHAPLLARAAGHASGDHGAMTTTLLRVWVELYQERRMGWIHRPLTWLLDQMYALGDATARALVATVRPPAASVAAVPAPTEAAGDDEEAQRKLAAKQRQEAILRQFAQQQSAFASQMSTMETDDDDDDSDSAYARGDGVAGSLGGGSSSLASSSQLLTAEEEAAAAMAREDLEGLTALETGTCILCQEPTDATSTRHFGLAVMVQPTTLIRSVVGLAGGSAEWGMRVTRTCAVGPSQGGAMVGRIGRDTDVRRWLRGPGPRVAAANAAARRATIHARRRVRTAGPARVVLWPFHAP